MPSLHIGKKRVNPVAASDGSTIPPGTVTVTAEIPGFLTFAVDPVTNAVTVTGVATCNGVNVTYSAPGFKSTIENYQVVDLPSLVVTDGPEQ